MRIESFGRCCASLLVELVAFAGREIPKFSDSSTFCEHCGEIVTLDRQPLVFRSASYFPT